MGITRFRPVGIAIDPSEYEDEEKVRYCSKCLAQFRELKNQSNLFDFGKTQLKPIERMSRLNKGKKKKHPDPEIQKELNKGSELIGYSTSSS